MSVYFQEQPKPCALGHPLLTSNTIYGPAVFDILFHYSCILSDSTVSQKLDSVSFDLEKTKGTKTQTYLQFINCSHTNVLNGYGNDTHHVGVPHMHFYSIFQ